MIQFYTIPACRFSIEKEVEMALEAGCRWVNLCASGVSSGQFGELARNIMSICREKDVILVIDDDIELVNELRVHGVRLTDGCVSAAKARETLGPHAVIGVKVNSLLELEALKGVDVDYVTVDVSVLDEIASAAARFQLPVVATGDVSIGNMLDLLKAGASGIGLSAYVVEAPEPVAYMEAALSKIADM